MKRKNEFQFLNYFKSLFYAPILHAPFVLAFLAAYFVLAVGLFCGIGPNTSIAGVVVCTLGALLFIAGIAISTYAERSPDIASLIPVSEKKKMLYRCLSILLMFVLIAVTILVIFVITALISFIFLQMPSCKEYLEEETAVETIEEVFFPMGVYGGIFSALYIVMMYSLGLMTGLFKRRRNRNIFLICVCVATLLMFILMGIPYKNNPVSYKGEYLLRATPFVNACYEAMKLPQLCIALWAVVTVAVLGCAIYMTIREYKKRISF